MGVLAFILISSTLGGAHQAAKTGLQINKEGEAVLTHKLDKKTKTMKVRLDENGKPQPKVVGHVVGDPEEVAELKAHIDMIHVGEF